ncbi:MAG: transposase [Candidatus Poribacteria bacterium]|nr:transposase [Candidatus Poribacteria bacterium]
MSECCIDAKFVSAKKGGECVGKTKCGKGTKLVAITEKSGRSVSVLITDASCHEVCLVEPALDACWTSESLAVLIGDKAYDSDPLDAVLRYRGTEMVAPHKKIARNRLHRVVVVSVDINAVSKWSVFSVGVKTSGGWSCGGNIMPKII